MHCLQFLTDVNLAEDVQVYDKDPQPQVVWPNGILASSAIGYVIGLLTGWSGSSVPPYRIDYGTENGVKLCTLHTCSDRRAAFFPRPARQHADLDLVVTAINPPEIEAAGVDLERAVETGISERVVS